MFISKTMEEGNLMSQFKKRIVTGMLAVFAFSVIYIVFSELKGITGFMEEHTNEKDLDVVKAGFIAQKDDYIYYIDYTDDGNLHRVDTNGREDTLIMEKRGRFLTELDGWAYFTGDYSNGYKLSKVKLDSGEIVEISSGDYMDSCIYGGQVYYVQTIGTQDFSEDTELMKMDLGSSRTAKITDGVREPVAGDGWIYYVNPDDENKLYRMRLNVTNNTKLYDKPVKSVHLYENWLFFIDCSDAHAMYRMRTDGTGAEKVIDLSSDAEILNVYGSIIYYDDGRKGLYRINANGGDKKFICYMWDVPVKNKAAWGIDVNRTGAVVEMFGGFVPLYKALDYITSYELPGFKLVEGSYDSRISTVVKDLEDTFDLAGCKNKFDDLLYIYPAGLYLQELDMYGRPAKQKLVQGRVVLGIKDAKEQRINEILEYISSTIRLRPTMVLFTTIDDDGLVRLCSIGYMTQSGNNIQKIQDGYYDAYDGDYSKVLSDSLSLWNNVPESFPPEFVDSILSQGRYIYVSGLYSSDGEMYAGEIGMYVYAPQGMDKESRIRLLNSIYTELIKRYKDPWLNIVLFRCEPGPGAQVDRQILSMGCRFPGEKQISIVYNSM